MKNRNIFALLVAVGDYSNMGIPNLPTYKMDLSLIGVALMTGLNVPRDNIRIMSGHENNGFITLRNFAQAIAEFEMLLTAEDIFVLYFSGHGKNHTLTFSDGDVELQSILDHLGKLLTKNTIAIVDACYSGNFDSTKKQIMVSDIPITESIGHGMQVLAATSSNSIARLGPGGNHSVFTGALSVALMNKSNIKKGNLSLNDIANSARELLDLWNKQNPNKEQYPVFRSNISGTLFFKVEDAAEYKTNNISYQTLDYKVVSIEPLSSLNEKRLCVFVTTEEKSSNEELAVFTEEIVEKNLYADVYSTEQRFRSMPATAIWCYFGCDSEDMTNHIYYAHTIWADDKVKSKYYRGSKHAEVLEGIYIQENSSYKILKEISKPDTDRDTYISQNKEMLTKIVSLAEAFITDIQECLNRSITVNELLSKYSRWTTEVRRGYLELSEMSVAPEDLHDWSDGIVNMAGSVLDISLYLEKCRKAGNIGDREMWLIKHSIEQYYQSLERLKDLEHAIL